MFKQVILAQRLTHVQRVSRATPLTCFKAANFSTSQSEASQSAEDGGSGGSGGGGGGGGFFFKLVGFSLLGIGGLGTACYLNSDVRTQLEMSLPYFMEVEDGLISVYSSFFTPSQARESTKPSDAPAKTPGKTVAKEIGDKAKVAPQTQPPQPMVPIVTKSAEKKPDAAGDLKAKEAAAKAKKAQDAAAVDRLLKKKKEEEDRAKAAAEKNRERILTDIAMKSNVMEHAVLDAISSQILLETKMREHSSLLKKAMTQDPTSEKSDMDTWAAVANAHEARVKALTGATQLLAKAEVEIEGLKSALDEGKDDSALLKNQIYQEAQKKLIQMKYDLATAQENTQKADAESTSVEIYKDLIERGKREFLKELESVKHMRLQPNKDSRMSEEEWNFLIGHAHRRVEQLRRRIVELELGQKDLIDSAVNLQRAKDEAVFERRLIGELERQKQEFEFDRQKVEAGVREGFDVELREALARQAAAHSDHLVHVLRVQQEEQNRRFELETRERLIREREEFRAAIEKWINRVRGLEAAVEQRAELERQGQLSHKLWLACQNFADSIIQGGSSSDLVPMKDHVATVMTASGNDPVLSKVLEGVGDVALERGVFSFEALGRRFRRVKSVCKSVALLDENDVSLFKLVLSWLQSFFIFDRAVIFAQDDDVPVDQLDAFTILSNAEEHVQNGDLEAALKFMAQLKGMPRLVAEDWIAECRRTLEVRLIAYVLMSFAGDRSARAVMTPES